MLLYISGSFPNNQEGIASGAKVLLDAMLQFVDKKEIILLTTNVPIISEHIEDNTSVQYKLMQNWKIRKKNIDVIYRLLDQYPITAIHMEYPGDLYGRTFLASILPLLIIAYNRKRKKHITFHVRLHEFTKARFLRKLAILPILWFADTVYVPAMKDRAIIAQLAGSKVKQTTIGTNIKVMSNELTYSEKKIISYFGSVYPGKGIERMLSIWQKIKEKDIEKKFLFKIIGDIGIESENHFSEYHKRVWRWIRQYGLEDCIEVTGYISDEEVSKEIQKSSIATLPYEDGLTLRRGSFLAYLSHGIPIVTTEGDLEAKALFEGHDGVAMIEKDEDFVNAIIKFSILPADDLYRIHKENIVLSENFRWENIAQNFLDDYKMTYSTESMEIDR